MEEGIHFIKLFPNKYFNFPIYIHYSSYMLKYTHICIHISGVAAFQCRAIQRVSILGLILIFLTVAYFHISSSDVEGMRSLSSQ